MSAVFPQCVGGVMSAGVAVPNHDAELRFYSDILSTGKDPLWRTDLMNNLGMPIIGLGERSAEYDRLPLQWMPHIQVLDVATSVERALNLHATELAHSKDPKGVSQWAVLQDPFGASFGLIPVVSEEEMAIPGKSAASDTDRRAGSICWLDLTVSDAASAQDFYRQVLACPVEELRVDQASEPYFDYNLIREDGQSAAGLCHARGTHADLPPLWMIYLPVGDLEESVRRVWSGGGKVHQISRRPDGALESAVIQDPVGVWLALVQG